MSESITINEFVHKIGFAVSLEGLNAYEKTLENIDNKMEDMYSGTNKIIGRLEDIGKNLTMKLTVPIVAFAGLSIAARSSQEAIEKSWTVFLGSSDLGVEFAGKIEDASRKLNYSEDQIDAYAKSLHRLRVPINEIMPLIEKFADISAGTGQDAGTLMEQYILAKNTPILRGRLLYNMLRSGALTEDDLKRAGIDPLKMRKNAGEGKLPFEGFEKIFSNLAIQNMGKAALLSDQLGKNMKNFWQGLEEIAESVGGVIENVLNLNTHLKNMTNIFFAAANAISELPFEIKAAGVIMGGFLAILGPGLLVIAGVAKAVTGLRIAMTALSLNPLVLQITAVVAGLTAMLVLMIAISQYIKNSENARIMKETSQADIEKNREKQRVALSKRVASGEITQEEADATLSRYRNVTRGVMGDNDKSVAPTPKSSIGMASNYGLYKPLVSGGDTVVTIQNPVIQLAPGTSQQNLQEVKSGASEFMKLGVQSILRAKR